MFEPETNFLNKQLKAGGLKPDKFLENQKWVITEPSNAPENFYMDGEITHAQAMKFWKLSMKRNGISAADIKKAVKLNFG